MPNSDVSRELIFTDVSYFRYFGRTKFREKKAKKSKSLKINPHKN